ncbi:MAG TPA: hypothetical protein VKT82_17205 [Ktedonobacterales bacterium]|nr:hypothetical protein [Ktedonobacterales bacterium]
MNDLLVLALGWLLVLIAFLSFLSLRRYMEHRERMAMIARGITPPEDQRKSLSQPMFIRRAGVLQGGLITAMVGLALTLGLYPIGFYVPLSLVGPYHLGPWLLAGLIPLAVGGALILGHYLTPGRPMELPAPRQTDRVDEQTPGGPETGEAPQGFSPRVEPITLPEARRWSSYRRVAGQPTETTEPDEEDPNNGPLPKANA